MGPNTYSQGIWKTREISNHLGFFSKAQRETPRPLGLILSRGFVTWDGKMSNEKLGGW